MPNGKVAFLWDESFLWGLMACKALRADGLPFELMRAEDIRKGALSGRKMLFVPGGWASNKLKALGDNGVDEIRKFVRDGGNYLGFCGGAGLATLDGIGLLPIKRKPTKERVPSFSGRINLTTSEHPLWRGIADPVFHAWWPSQFIIEDQGIQVLASYGAASSDSFSSDLNTGDVADHGSWPEMEQKYRINLDPRRLVNDPAVVGGLFGKGRVILSLIHFDTPDDRNGAAALRNAWDYLAKDSNESQVTSNAKGSNKLQVTSNKLKTKGESGDSLLSSGLEAAISELVALGARNFLWFWRNPMLLQWRRGIRGLEYCTLHVLIREIAGILRADHSFPGATASGLSIENSLDTISKMLLPFLERAKRLLVLERLALQSGHITYERCDDPEIREIRTELFSHSKSYGGQFKILIDEIDMLLYSLLKQQAS